MLVPRPPLRPKISPFKSSQEALMASGELGLTVLLALGLFSVEGSGSKDGHGEAGSLVLGLGRACPGL